jgi:hypothetical protein
MQHDTELEYPDHQGHQNGYRECELDSRGAAQILA